MPNDPILFSIQHSQAPAIQAFQSEKTPPTSTSHIKKPLTPRPPEPEDHLTLSDFFSDTKSLKPIFPSTEDA